MRAFAYDYSSEFGVFRNFFWKKHSRTLYNGSQNNIMLYCLCHSVTPLLCRTNTRSLNTTID